MGRDKDNLIWQQRKYYCYY